MFFKQPYNLNFRTIETNFFSSWSIKLHKMVLMDMKESSSFQMLLSPTTVVQPGYFKSDSPQTRLIILWSGLLCPPTNHLPLNASAAFQPPGCQVPLSCSCKPFGSHMSDVAIPKYIVTKSVIKQWFLNERNEFKHSSYQVSPGQLRFTSV